MDHLPAPRTPSVVHLPDGTPAYTDHLPATYQPTNAVPQIVHVHQAPPDRTVQRLTLGSGVGAGAVAAGVYFGPLLVGVLTAIAANLALLALVASVCAWGVVTVVKSVGGADGKVASSSLRKGRRR
ncbi:hypothetical protein ASD97_37415 [Streptomyces sp. Root63]|uniref:DUF6251 family protein n=1 Tax=unclassified Streptomyces TaxID=2593676 RepID=UPI0006FD2C20|nr:MULTISPECIES: DUF6251 family protein [unclassified Streptomyces]KQX32210.1 hypothetical protein ASD29_15545 [Streptomyces sp. Root1295]KRA47080.1 hypothetical protein ASD97_37415 [Streptomyces sp. Root63]